MFALNTVVTIGLVALNTAVTVIIISSISGFITAMATSLFGLLPKRKTKDDRYIEQIDHAHKVVNEIIDWQRQEIVSLREQVVSLRDENKQLKQEKQPRRHL